MRGLLGCLLLRTDCSEQIERAAISSSFPGRRLGRERVGRQSLAGGRAGIHTHRQRPSGSACSDKAALTALLPIRVSPRGARVHCRWVERLRAALLGLPGPGQEAIDGGDFGNLCVCCSDFLLLLCDCCCGCLPRVCLHCLALASGSFPLFHSPFFYPCSLTLDHHLPRLAPVAYVSLTCRWGESTESAASLVLGFLSCVAVSGQPLKGWNRLCSHLFISFFFSPSCPLCSASTGLFDLAKALFLI